jgi:hypothetical protein
VISRADRGAYRGKGCKGPGFALKPGSPHTALH